MAKILRTTCITVMGKRNDSATVFWHRGDDCKRYEVKSRSSIRRCHRAQLRLMAGGVDSIDADVLESLMDEYVRKVARYEGESVQSIQRILHVKDDRLYPFLDWLRDQQGEE